MVYDPSVITAVIPTDRPAVDPFHGFDTGQVDWLLRRATCGSSFGVAIVTFT